eukprot:TRINITY_DN10512_c0_g2_i1.p1 TRINITY_DN10512_c0_g2~~TRINITY_DN10512_c0_g2_i1.p1  ORF type:complete len:705 (+),score=220.39 TRINITY_DN10512_c0_g2_i1:31-2115(+)
MAAKKKMVLQTPLNSDAELKDFISQDGLKVVDVYTEWYGPCKALESTFKRLKLDTADDLLLFATVNICHERRIYQSYHCSMQANTNKIEALKEFNGTAEPCFVFYGGDTCVNVVRGAEGPRVVHAIEDELQKEHDAIDNGTERVPFQGTGTSVSRGASAKKRPTSATRQASAKPASADAIPEEPEKAFTFAIIKPDAVAANNADAIFAKLAEAGFKVAAQDDRTLTEEEAKQFYAEHEGKEFFPNLVEFMTSGPIKPLVLSAPDAIAQWRSMIGPTNTNVAKEEAPESLRALYGTDQTKNALHGADSPASAAREIDFFFPEWASTNLPAEEVVLVVTPDATATETLQSIAQALDAAGFSIDDQKSVQLTEESVKRLGDMREDLQAHMLSGEVVCIRTSRPLAVSKLAGVIGPADIADAKEAAPESVRGKFAEDAVKCAVFVPTDIAAAVKELFEEHDPENEVSEAALNAEGSGEAVEGEGDANETTNAAGESDSAKTETEETAKPDDAQQGEATESLPEGEGDAAADAEASADEPKPNSEDKPAEASEGDAAPGDSPAADPEGAENEAKPAEDQIAATETSESSEGAVEHSNNEKAPELDTQADTQAKTTEEVATKAAEDSNDDKTETNEENEPENPTEADEAKPEEKPDADDSKPEEPAAETEPTVAEADNDDKPDPEATSAEATDETPAESK